MTVGNGQAHAHSWRLYSAASLEHHAAYVYAPMHLHLIYIILMYIYILDVIVYIRCMHLFMLLLLLLYNISRIHPYNSCPNLPWLLTYIRLSASRPRYPDCNYCPSPTIAGGLHSPWLWAYTHQDSKRTPAPTPSLYPLSIRRTPALTLAYTCPDSKPTPAVTPGPHPLSQPV